jgi:4-hydroxyphenylpyruvate dioxygenase-like putative hemolysin
VVVSQTSKEAFQDTALPNATASLNFLEFKMEEYLLRTEERSGQLSTQGHEESIAHVETAINDDSQVT